PIASGHARRHKGQGLRFRAAGHAGLRCGCAPSRRSVARAQAQSPVPRRDRRAAASTLLSVVRIAPAVHDNQSGMNMADAPAPHAAADPAPAVDAPALRVRGLGKRVALPSGPLTILEGVGFEIARGEVVAVVGASGSGKSTLLSLL